MFGWTTSVCFVGPDASTVADEALAGYTSIEYLLEGAGLNLSLNKTGYLASSAAARKCLLRSDGHPQVEDLMKDLGLDSSGARRRRVTTVKKSIMNQGNKRFQKMQQLGIRNRPVKVRLWKGGNEAQA